MDLFVCSFLFQIEVAVWFVCSLASQPAWLLPTCLWWIYFLISRTKMPEETIDNFRFYSFLIHLQRRKSSMRSSRFHLVTTSETQSRMGETRQTIGSHSLSMSKDFFCLVLFVYDLAGDDDSLVLLPFHSFDFKFT